MSKKSISTISKLWKKTSFHCLLDSSQHQMTLICDKFDRILTGYSTFQSTVLSTMKQLRTTKLKIPALTKLKQQLLKNRPQIQQLITEQCENIKKLINQLSQYKYVLQKSQINALKEYHHMMDYFLSGDKEKFGGLTLRKIQDCHDGFKIIEIQDREVIRDRVSTSPFEKWMADFSIRSQQFFQKAYSPYWQDQAKDNSLTFIKVKSSQFLNGLCFSKQPHPRRPTVKDQLADESFNQFACRREISGMEQEQEQEQEEEQDQEQGDIVSQIYKEFEKPKKIQQSSNARRLMEDI